MVRRDNSPSARPQDRGPSLARLLTLAVAPLAPALLGLAGLASGWLAPAAALAVAGLGGLAVAVALALRLRRGAPPPEDTVASSPSVASEAEEARRLAEAAIRERDRVFSFVSHELRSPLHAMHAWLSILASSTDAVTQRRAVDVLERNLSLQSRLVEDLLDASRISTGKLQLERQRCDLAQIVQLVFRGERLVAEEQGIELILDCAARAPVYGDFERLQQAVGNLVSNAIKFTDEGGRIRITLLVDDETAVVHVEDSGRGIAADALAHVFDLYEQERPAAADESAGLGLGLAIVSMVVREHGGEVSAHSDGRGLGARFELRLPMIEGGDPADPEPAPEPSPDVLDGLRVLVVDANRGSAEALALTLEEAGAVVDWARSPTAARASADAAMPDALVCGLEEEQATSLLKELRAAQPRLRSLALLEPRSADLRSRLRRAGFEATARRASPPAEVRGRMIRLLGRQPNVFVVDDDRDSADSLALLLRRRGFEVAVAYGFAEALRIAQSLELDLVVTDVSLPDGDGAELARRLRVHGARRIVAVSGFARDEVDPDGERFDGFVRKPIDLEALMGSLAGD